MNNQIFKTNLEKLTGETKQNKIADALNVSVSKVSKWFNGALLPTIGDLLNISKKYNCSIDWLIGNEVNSKPKELPSTYAICKFLSDLDKALLINMELEDVTEIVSFWDDDKETYVDKKYKYQVPTVHFPRTKSMTSIENKLSSSSLFLDLYDDSYDYSCIINNGTILESNIEISDFLSKYTKIREVLKAELITEDTFDDIINSYLRRLTKKTIDYFPWNPAYEPKQLTKEELDQLPFDASDGVTDVLKALMDFAEKNYNINDAIEKFIERFNVDFFEE